MFKNREVRILSIVNIIVIIIFILSCILFSLSCFNSYKKSLITNNSNLIGGIIKKHPELENDIINYLMNDNNFNSEYGLEILNKYGLDDSEYLDYVSNNNKLKNCMIVYNVLLVLCISIIFFLVYFLFLKWQYKKINHIDKYMNNILHNDYSLDIRDYREGDLSNLKNDVYKMTIKLKEQNELAVKHKKDLEETLADISHQIKTPLTSMYVINDILLDNDIDEKSRKDFLNKNRVQLERIEWLVTTLLKISRLDSGMVVLKKEQIKISDLIEKALCPIKIMAELKNIDLIVNSIDCKCNLDFNWTVEALINILKNACEHTENGGKIIVDVLDNPLFFNIKITDNGSGIKKEEIKHIFERFYKGNHNKDSIGIGLNMAKKIINLQDGNIECISDFNVGTCFDIKFYKKEI